MPRDLGGVEPDAPCYRRLADTAGRCDGVMRIEASGQVENRPMRWLACDSCGWVCKWVVPDVPQDALPGFES